MDLCSGIGQRVVEAVDYTDPAAFVDMYIRVKLGAWS
jgi:hypothetical protein